MRPFLICVGFVCQIVFVILRSIDVIAWHWLLVLIPLWLWLLERLFGNLFKSDEQRFKDEWRRLK